MKTVLSWILGSLILLLFLILLFTVGTLLFIVAFVALLFSKFPITLFESTVEIYKNQ